MVTPREYHGRLKYNEQYLPHAKHLILCFIMYKEWCDDIPHVTLRELTGVMDIPTTDIGKKLRLLVSRGYLERSKYGKFSSWKLTNHGREYAKNIYQHRHYYRLDNPAWITKAIIKGFSTCDAPVNSLKFADSLYITKY